ncbi:MAG: hypoxanthine phosphoribosyltransferase [Bacteroidaceae bacterium]|nr:hypoxanthine phosphoribosyltransferase [Bacteroidaceae bacterium]MBO5951829.1 hypoxanthine phosphoribosyltransferase [Bacteroidaceae bacterium]
MKTVQVKDKQFELFISEDKLQSEIKRIADSICNDYLGKSPLFLVILNGSFMFASDLFKNIQLPVEISFIKVSSYSGVASTECVKELIGLNEDIEGRDIIIVEDVVDTGLTMKDTLALINAKNPSSVSICTLLFKPNKLQVNLDVKYVAMEIPDDFIVGYGLDYDGYGRNLRDIYKIIK